MRWPIIFALATVAGCNSGDPPDEGPEAETAAASPAPVDAPVVAASEPADDGGTGIPTQMQGRWGLVAADCEPGRSDAKGLMEVGTDRLEFYESVAVLDDVEERSAQALRASFGMTGEGMTWDRDMALSLENGGETLVRREFGDDASPAPLEYSRCA